jgi:hypothetical protein
MQAGTWCNGLCRCARTQWRVFLTGPGRIGVVLDALDLPVWYVFTLPVKPTNLACCLWLFLVCELDARFFNLLFAIWEVPLVRIELEGGEFGIDSLFTRR